MDTPITSTGQNYETIWMRMAESIRKDVSSSNFDTWFAEVNISKLDDSGVLTIGVPNEFVKNWIQQKYSTLVLKAAQNELPEVRSIKIVVSRINKSKKSSRNSQSKIGNKIPFDSYSVDPETKLSSRYTFDSFILAPYNTLAGAAAKAVVERPGAEYNPFFIYGAPGTGKTHLIQAIGNRVASLYPQLSVYYLTSEEFVIGYQRSVQNLVAHEFKEKYRSYDLLIIDDCQFFDSGKKKSMEELFHLFCALYDQNKQIIFSADRHPSELPDLEERLKSRFSSGMVVDLPSLDLESREIVAREKAKTMGISIGDSVIKHIAESSTGGVREIEGALKTLKLHIDTYKKPLDLATAKNILQKNIKSKVINYKDVIKKTCTFFEVDQNLIFEKTRKKEIVVARQASMYLLRECLDMSFSSIGKCLGNKDHTTVIHSCDKIKSQIEKDVALKERVENVKRSLGV